MRMSASDMRCKIIKILRMYITGCTREEIRSKLGCYSFTRMNEVVKALEKEEVIGTLPGPSGRHAVRLVLKNRDLWTPEGVRADGQ